MKPQIGMRVYIEVLDVHAMIYGSYDGYYVCIDDSWQFYAVDAEFIKLLLS